MYRIEPYGGASTHPGCETRAGLCHRGKVPAPGGLRPENSAPPPAEAIGGALPTCSVVRLTGILSVLHTAFLAIRVASIGVDATYLSLPVKVALTSCRPHVLPKLEP
jgi:hypothetical protein